MKLISCLIILFCCTAFGFWYGQTYQETFLFYRDFRSFHRDYLHNLKTKRRTIPDLIEKGNYGSAFSTALTLSIFEKRFDKKDKLFQDYCSMLGISDYETQLSTISNYTEEIENAYKSNEANAKKYTALYRKIGFLIGVFIVILIL